MGKDNHHCSIFDKKKGQYLALPMIFSFTELFSDVYISVILIEDFVSII